jgi:hypothetical protein
LVSLEYYKKIGELHSYLLEEYKSMKMLKEYL